MRCTAFIVLMLLCSVVYGQSLFVGVKGGAAFNSAPYKTPAVINMGDVSGKIALLCGFKAGVELKHVQAGVGVDYGAYGYKISNGSQTGVVSMPYAYPHGFANYKVGVRKMYVYAGVNAGYAISGTVSSWDKANPSGTKIKGGKFTNGVSGGVQAGISCPVTKRLHIQGEMGARYLPIKAGTTYYDAGGNPIGQQEDKPVFTVPVTIGVSYRIMGK